jgi:hypothetical protein
MDNQMQNHCLNTNNLSNQKKPVRFVQLKRLGYLGSRISTISSPRPFSTFKFPSPADELA